MFFKGLAAVDKTGDGLVMAKSTGWCRYDLLILQNTGEFLARYLLRDSSPNFLTFIVLKMMLSRY